MLPGSPTCSSCILWLLQPGLETGHGARRGQCRARSPSVLAVGPEGKVVSRWPLTLEDDWCAEHAIADTESGVREEFPRAPGIQPTEADIGRSVIYHGHAGEREEGTITSFNEHYVFVRYGSSCNSTATRRDQLTWSVP